MKPMDLKRDRGAERGSQVSSVPDSNSEKVVQLRSPSNDGEPDPQLDARLAWIEGQPEETQRLHRANLAAGAGAEDLAETVSAAMSELKPADRVRLTLKLCNDLPDSERAEVLTQAKYDMPALKVAYAKAKPKDRRALLDSLSSAQKLRIKRRSVRRGGASHLEGQLTALDASLRQRANDVAEDRQFSEQDWANFWHDASSRLLRIRWAMEHAGVARGSELLALCDRQQLRWENEPETGRRLWRAMEAKSNDPEIREINEQAKGDRPVRPASVRSQLGRFVK